jgi:hypothetical protein
MSDQDTRSTRQRLEEMVRDEWGLTDQNEINKLSDMRKVAMLLEIVFDDLNEE